MSLLKKSAAKLFRRVIYLERELLGSLGLHEHLFRTAKGARIIVYHGVCQEDPLKFNTLFITKKTFEAHLQFYQKYFHIISLADFYNENFKEGRFNICLSFDDGFANNYEYVLPLLEKYWVPATFFITAIRKENSDILWNDFLTIVSVDGPQSIIVEGETFHKQNGKKYVSALTKLPLAETLRSRGFTAKKECMKLLEPYAYFRYNNTTIDYWLQMTTDQIKALSASPFATIGSHGHYHNDLSKITREEIVDEVFVSKEFLEGVIQKPVNTFAFPYGSYSQAVIDEAIKAGYDQLLVTDFLHPDDKKNNMLKERMGINPFISVHNQMYAIIKGNYV